MEIWNAGITFTGLKQETMTTQILKETLAAIKGVYTSEIKNLTNDTFELSKSRFSFDLTPSGKYVKSGSVKFLSTIEDYANCSY